MRVEDIVELLRFYSNNIGDYYKQGMKSAINQLEVEMNSLYQKGYQDGFKQAKFDIEMDKINEGKV